MATENENIIRKINALMNKTVENGATEAEASAALELAQKLMTQHMIESTQLAEHAKEKKCERIDIQMFETGYDTDALNGAIARAFDCKCFWNRYYKRVTFFGFGDDAKLAAYFYNFLNNAVVNEAEKFKASRKFRQEKMKTGHHGKTIMASFRKGMIYRLMERLDELKRSRVRNVIEATGRDLVVVKEQTVEDEYKNLGVKVKTKSMNWDVENVGAFFTGKEKADKVNMTGGITTEQPKMIGAK